MLPLRDDVLRLLYIAELWSRELGGIRTADEIENELLSAFWRGELVVHHQSGSSRRQIDRSAMLGELNVRREHLGFSFVDSADLIPPLTIIHADRSVSIDRRRYIILPIDAARWTDDFQRSAYEALAEMGLGDFDPLVTPVLAGLSVTKEAFANFCDEGGYDRPRFWFEERRKAQWTVRREREAERWFGEIAKGKKRKSKSRYHAEAVSLFPGLPEKAFNRIWRRSAPEEWKRSGPVIRSPRS